MEGREEGWLGPGLSAVPARSGGVGAPPCEKLLNLGLGLPAYEWGLVGGGLCDEYMEDLLIVPGLDPP